MIDAIKEIFPYGDKHGRSMTVNEFQDFVSSELPQPVFERRHGRQMTKEEKQNSIMAIDQVRMLRDIQNIFSNILSASEKYQNVQSYVIYRLAQLTDQPNEYHHYLVDIENVKRFDSMETALPSDPEILATMLTALMDQCAASLQHPRHYMDYGCKERIKSIINNSITNKN